MTNWRWVFAVGLLLAPSELVISAEPAGRVAPAAQGEETATPSPSPTPAFFSAQTLSDLKRIQQAALSSDYAYRQVAHLSDNIGPRLSGSAQAAKAVEYVASELKAIGCEVQLEKAMVPHWVRGEETATLLQWPGMAENRSEERRVGKEC